MKSEVGRGATFTVLLPAVARSAESAGAAQAGRGAASRPARILVVDDEEVVRDIVCRTLEDEGYEVVQARNGEEALGRLSLEHAGIDLVLSDAVMPGLGGREFAARLAEHHPEVPVVWMSGYPRDSALGQTERAGAQPFLQKPVPAEVLLQTVGEAVAAGQRSGR